ncbi:hypothetical protein F5Y17DRAFT_243990 [Xylariaceae sp. FL0594]|nr:hypothetical protein F5Y17DRAFT_243990 [Xylariaceae sp. FL0594]
MQTEKVIHPNNYQKWPLSHCTIPTEISMIYRRLIFPALLAATAPLETWGAHQHSRRLHSHQHAHEAEPVVEQNSPSKEPSSMAQTTCSAVLPGICEHGPSMVERRDEAEVIMGGSALDTEQEELSRMVSDLNNATSGAINYMMHLVLSMQSLSLRLAVLETASSMPTSSSTSTSTSDAYTTGPASPTGTTRSFGDISPSLSNAFSGPRVPSQTQIIQVIPVSTNGSSWLSTSTSFIFPPSTPAGAGQHTESASPSPKTTWTSTSTVTVTVDPPSSASSQATANSVPSSSTYGPVPESSSPYSFPAIPSYNSSSLASAAIPSPTVLTSFVRVTVTIPTTYTFRPPTSAPPSSLSLVHKNSTVQTSNRESHGPGTSATTPSTFDAVINQ